MRMNVRQPKRSAGEGSRLRSADFQTRVFVIGRPDPLGPRGIVQFRADRFLRRLGRNRVKLPGEDLDGTARARTGEGER